MSNTEQNLSAAGIYTIAELSERTTVPDNTIRMWVKKGWLPVVKIDGKWRSTVHMVKLAAEQAREDGRGKPRGWKLEPVGVEDPEVVTA